jgi:hypothetical protein
MKQFGLAISLVLAMVLPGSAEPGDVKVHGIKLTLPPAWIVATEVDWAQRYDAFPELFERLGLSRALSVPLFAFDTVFDEFYENVNLNITPGGLHISSADVEPYRDTLMQMLRGRGIEPQIISASHEVIGKRNAIAVTYDLLIPMTEVTVRQRQLLIAGAAQTYILTFTAEASQFESYNHLFDRVLESVVFDDGPFEWWSGLNPIIRNAAVGGLVGALLAGLFFASRKFRK